jgi:hypothetical protein
MENRPELFEVIQKFCLVFFSKLFSDSSIIIGGKTLQDSKRQGTVNLNLNFLLTDFSFYYYEITLFFI